MTDIELERQRLQKELDASKTLHERNKLGQYATPYILASQICDHIMPCIGDMEVSLLEPSIGTGVFYSALSEKIHISKCVGYEIDKHYFIPAVSLWRDHNVRLMNEDFLEASPEDTFSVIMANPPYSRHHYIPADKKRFLAQRIRDRYGLDVSGLSGLYVYFMILSTQWLRTGGYSCWLVPSEFLSVNYGVALKRFLLHEVDLVSIHSYSTEDVQFDDALVSSSVVVFRNSRDQNDIVRFSWGNDINNPQRVIEIKKTALDPLKKWNESFLCKGDNDIDPDITIGRFFKITRGVATGDNRFFIINGETAKEYDIPMEYLLPVIPPPRNLDTNVYSIDRPTSDRIYLLNCRKSMEYISKNCGGLSDYIDYGIRKGVNLRANCRNRNPWYGCETRTPAPIVVSYMGRDNKTLPIRFILNKAGAIVTNSYLMLYPLREYSYMSHNPDIIEKVWKALSNIPKETMLAYGRSYGGGLLKWEPKELEAIPCPELGDILKPLNPSLFDDDGF